MSFYKKICNNRPLIMGILNITPDSFYDGNKYVDFESIKKRIIEMQEQDVDIIDIGAVSSRPGAIDISENEEANRLLDIYKKIKHTFPDIITSIDTYRSSIAKETIKYGANIINDIYAGNYDSNIIQVVKEKRIPYVAMHMNGNPKNMQSNIEYKNFKYDILSFFEKKIREIQNAGHNEIIIDPGFGFGKTLNQNYQLINILKELTQFGLPILVGLSRKSMISNLLNTRAKNTLNGTTILNTIAVMNGANIIRVHDLKEAKEIKYIINMINQNEF